MRTRSITSVIAVVAVAAAGCGEEAFVEPAEADVPVEEEVAVGRASGRSMSARMPGRGSRESTGGGEGGSGGRAGVGGSGEGGSGAGGSEPLVAPEESCPGAGVALGLGDHVSIVGTTVGKLADHAVGCVPASGPDAVHRLDLAGACTLKIDLLDAGFDGAFSLRTGGCEAEVGCFDRSPDDEHAAVHAEAGSVWLVVQGADQSAGDYELQVTCAPPVCGDGVVGPGEQCDPALAVSHDGCGDPGTGSACRFVAPAGADTCDGAVDAIAVPPGTSVWPNSDAPYDTSDAVDDYAPECALVSETGGRDEVIAFVPQDSGLLRITVGADRDGFAFCQTGSEPECWRRYVSVRESHCAEGRVQACAADDPSTGITDVDLTVIGGETYYLIVDGRDAAADASGPYLVRFNLEAVPEN